MAGQRLQLSFCVRLLQGKYFCYEDLLAAEESNLPGFKWAKVDENTACGLCYTSGTTGRPKVSGSISKSHTSIAVCSILMECSSPLRQAFDDVHVLFETGRGILRCCGTGDCVLIWCAAHSCFRLAEHFAADHLVHPFSIMAAVWHNVSCVAIF